VLRFEAVAALRPRVWPNLLILELGDALLGRNGEIIAAVGASTGTSGRAIPSSLSRWSTPAAAARSA
jgi:hypothetical protein